MELNQIISEILISLKDNKSLLNDYEENLTNFFQKKQLPANEYLEQLEKNVIYNKSLFFDTLDVLVEYIYTPNKNLNFSNPVNDILSIAQKKSMSQASYIISYLSHGALNNIVSDDIKHLRNLKDAENFQELFDELEFQIIYYKGHYETLQYFILILVNNEDISQLLASKFSRGLVHENIRMGIREFINILHARSKFAA